MVYRPKIYKTRDLDLMHKILVSISELERFFMRLEGVKMQSAIVLQSPCHREEDAGVNATFAGEIKMSISDEDYNGDVSVLFTVLCIS
jgi:hypothetical protein